MMCFHEAAQLLEMVVTGFSINDNLYIYGCSFWIVLLDIMSQLFLGVLS